MWALGTLHYPAVLYLTIVGCGILVEGVRGEEVQELMPRATCGNFVYEYVCFLTSNRSSFELDFLLLKIAH